MLQLRNIIYKYTNDYNSFEINISELEFRSGLISAILGKNGSGKTTLLNLIGGHLLCQQGEIRLSQNVITNMDAKDRDISTVLQTISLFPHLSVKENIEIAIEPNSLFRTKTTTREYAKKIISDFDLLSISDRKPNQLSIGQQQRVAIARAIATKPSILLLDEPTSSLDFVNIKYLKNLLNELKNNHTVPICIIVSHDLNFVLDVADEIKYIEDGKLIFDNNKENFINSKYNIN